MKVWNVCNSVVDFYWSAKIFVGVAFLSLVGHIGLMLNAHAMLSPALTNLRCWQEFSLMLQRLVFLNNSPPCSSTSRSSSRSSRRSSRSSR
eukprot:4539933-Amphidinium_carterae.1